jgi:hypothetical protein
MHSFPTERKLFLIATLVFVLEFEAGLVVAFQLNLSDPTIGGSSRNHWVLAGTPLTAPGAFMAPYVLFLLLPFGRRWVGVIGIAGVTLLAVIAGLAWIPDYAMVQRILTQHLTIWTGLPLGVLALITPTIVVLGILTLLRHRAVRRKGAVIEPDPLPMSVSYLPEGCRSDAGATAAPAGGL